MSHKEKNKLVKGVLAALTAVSVALGAMFESPQDLVKSGEAVFPPAVIQPVRVDKIVMELEEPGNGEEEEEEEEKKTFSQKLKELVLRVPRPVRAVIGVPLWAAGHVIDRLAAALWTAVLSPVLGHILRWIVSSLILLGVLALILKLLFPNIPWRKLLNKKTILAVLIFTAVCEIADWVMPVIWEDYKKISNWIRAGGSLVLITSVVLAFRKRFGKHKTPAAA